MPFSKTGGYNCLAPSSIGTQQRALVHEANGSAFSSLNCRSRTSSNNRTGRESLIQCGQFFCIQGHVESAQIFKQS